MEIGDDGVESRLKVEVGALNFPVYLRRSKMSLGHQAFFLLAFVAYTRIKIHVLYQLKEWKYRHYEQSGWVSI
ncbi:hypothetical protein MRB53_035030 [Persea americana]|uniref:Uncharacterized protein n=1 Tax=Persea americana TaxID=3435 RepID=A0ACC2K439_PERAE|nr:hypothetical protein MRB53_035030 [Persea americana]